MIILTFYNEKKNTNSFWDSSNESPPFLPQFVLVLSGDNEGLAIYLIPQTKHRGKPKENTVKGGKVLKGLAIFN